MSDLDLRPDVVEPDRAAARTVLSAFGLDPHACRIDRPAQAAGFSGALILRIREGERTWSLRRWPPGGLSPERLRALHHFLQSLQKGGIDVLPVPARSRDTLVEHQAQWWQLEPWLPGRADFHQHPSEERLRSTMRKLAAIHTAAAKYAAPPASRQWFSRSAAAPSPASRERLQIARAWPLQRCDVARAKLTTTAPPEFRDLALEILRDFQFACGSITRELQTLCEVPVPVHPCLRDVWHDHLLLTGDELTGVVDPSAARSENVASDLSRLLGSLLADDRPRWEAALDCYHDVRPLSSDERHLVAVLDRSSVLLSGLTWIDRCLQGQLGDEQLPRVLPRLQIIHKRLAHLVRSEH